MVGTAAEARILSITPSKAKGLRLRHSVEGFSLQPSEGGVFNLCGTALAQGTRMGELILFGAGMRRIAHYSPSPGMSAQQAMRQLSKRLPPAKPHRPAGGR